MRKRKQLLLFIIIAGLACTLFADDKAKLKKINAKISQLQNYVHQKQAKQDDLQDELANIEKQTNQINLRLYRLNQQIKQQQKQLRPLQKQQASLQKKLAMQRSGLSQQLLSAYQMGSASNLQLFLSQQQPSDVTRIQTYYQAINHARQKLITNYLATLSVVKQNQQKINVVIEKLQQLQTSRKDEQKVLRQKMANRKVILKTIQRQIHTSRQRIATLQANKKRLQKVVNNIAAEKQLASLKGLSFANLKRRLPWPVKGTLVRSYGQIYDGRMRSNGVFIKAAMNAPVRAIATGEVVFAKWLRGYGNMIIISHKGGYMTLYGHNSALLVNVGQIVQPGEAIALTGNSGGLINSGLYFEVRYRGQTRNPALWCR